VEPTTLPAEQVRIGDSERREVDEALQRAVGDGVLTLGEYEERAALVWQARTRGDLHPLTRDLPGAQPAPVAPGAAGRHRWGVAVMSGHEVVGPVAPGQRIHAVAMMGSARVDLRRTDLPPVVDVDAVAVMGGIEILVPVGARVEAGGFSLMGGREERLQPPRPAAPLVRVSAHALMGGIEISHGPRRQMVEAGEPVAVLGTGRWGGGAIREAARTAVAVRTRRPPRRRGPRRLRRLAAAVVIGGVLVGGAGVATDARDGAAVFGSKSIDVGPVPAGTTRTIDVGTLFGSVEVVVPDGARVTTYGSVIFGSQDCQACVAGASAAPTAGVVRVRGRGAFGSVEIRTESQARDAARD